MSARARLTPERIAEASRELVSVDEVPHALAIKAALIGRVRESDLHFRRLVKSIYAAVDCGVVTAAIEGRVLAFRAAEARQ